MDDKTLDDLVQEVEAQKAVEDIMREDAARLNAKITMLANRLTENMQRVLTQNRIEGSYNDESGETAGNREELQGAD